jgi:hypothetical protein
MTSDERDFLANNENEHRTKDKEPQLCDPSLT